eukprot:3118389-Pyramimonas_sp.AAC.1
MAVGSGEYSPLGFAFSSGKLPLGFAPMNIGAALLAVGCSASGCAGDSQQLCGECAEAARASRACPARAGKEVAATASASRPSRWLYT